MRIIKTLITSIVFIGLCNLLNAGHMVRLTPLILNNKPVLDIHIYDDIESVSVNGEVYELGYENSKLDSEVVIFDLLPNTNIKSLRLRFENNMRVDIGKGSRLLRELVTSSSLIAPMSGKEIEEGYILNGIIQSPETHLYNWRTNPESVSKIQAGALFSIEIKNKDVELIDFKNNVSFWSGINKGKLKNPEDGVIITDDNIYKIGYFQNQIFLSDYNYSKNFRTRVSAEKYKTPERRILTGILSSYSNNTILLQGSNRNDLLAGLWYFDNHIIGDINVEVDNAKLGMIITNELFVEELELTLDVIKNLTNITESEIDGVYYTGLWSMNTILKGVYIETTRDIDEIVYLIFGTNDVVTEHRNNLPRYYWLNTYNIENIIED